MFLVWRLLFTASYGCFIRQLQWLVSAKIEMDYYRLAQSEVKSLSRLLINCSIFQNFESIKGKLSEAAAQLV